MNRTARILLVDDDVSIQRAVAPLLRSRGYHVDVVSTGVEAVKAVLLAAIRAGGSTLRDYAQPNGELGYFQHRWAVYGKEGEACPACTCAEGVRRITQAGRSTFYCPVCQR